MIQNQKNQFLKKLKYLKLELNDCKKYTPLDLFDSRFDIMPSLKSKLSKHDSETIKNEFKFFYDKKKILSEMQQQAIKKAKKSTFQFSCSVS